MQATRTEHALSFCCSQPEPSLSLRQELLHEIQSEPRYFGTRLSIRNCGSALTPVDGLPRPVLIGYCERVCTRGSRHADLQTKQCNSAHCNRSFAFVMMRPVPTFKYTIHLRCRYELLLDSGRRFSASGMDLLGGDAWRQKPLYS